MDLSARLRALVLVKWQLGGEGFGVRRLGTTEAVVNLPLFYKDLGAFDVARPVAAERAVERLSEYARPARAAHRRRGDRAVRTSRPSSTWWATCSPK